MSRTINSQGVLIPNQTTRHIVCASRVINQTMARNQHDHFYRMAKKGGYRSRAAYKPKQINSRLRVIRRGDSVVDPGGWLRMAKELSGGGGMVLCVDIQPIRKRHRISLKTLRPLR